MTITCPACHGKGECVHHNGVDPQKGQQLDTCWMCHGTGEVIEEKHPIKLHIRKYWNTDQLMEKVLVDNIGAWQTLANE